MFGSKKEKDGDLDQTTPRSSTESPTSDNNSLAQPKLQTDGLVASVESNSPVRKPDDNSLTQVPSPSTPVSESKKRRSSGTAKAKEIFSQAKNSLIHGDRDGPQTPMQKLSKTDAALSVPQGSLNNSAGESHPTANSSFLVGVTEDKNKKCRRTMEDTHAYLYNFLGTPAPVLPSQASTKSRRSLDSDSRLSQVVTAQSDQSQHVVETDNGYFAVFDGHAGSFAAEWCGKKIHVLLEDLMRKNPNTPVPELLDQTYTSADQQLERLPLKNSGCTAITAVLRWEDRVPNGQSATGSQAIAPLAAQALKNAESETANAGEATGERKASTVEEAIQEVKQKATRQRVLYTANVGDENEGRRISKAGGLILNNRVNGVLAVTRALGDSYLKDLVTGHPYTTETVIQPDQDEFLILACDGVSYTLSAKTMLANVHASSGMSPPTKKP
jgi:protein phosphatase PTC1